MGRLIDEDIVIDIINFECGKWTGLSKTIEKEIKALPSAQPSNGACWGCQCEKVEKLQPERERGKWIPCSERLPEKYGNYLVTTDDGEVDIGSCDPENKDRQDHFWSGCDADGFFWYGENIVIAWMPLPEPYQGEGEQE